MREREREREIERERERDVPVSCGPNLLRVKLPTEFRNTEH
jgi:hypothetical protein